MLKWIDRNVSIRTAQTAAFVAFLCLIALGVFVFMNGEARGAGGEGGGQTINQSKIRITGTDSTDWYDLQRWGWPNVIVWQLDIVNHNCQAAAESLYVSIQSSNHESPSDRSLSHWTVGHFEKWPSSITPAKTYGFDSTTVGSTYRFTIPRQGIPAQDSAVWLVRPLEYPGRYLRLYFSTTDSRTWSIQYPVSYHD